MSNVTNLDHHRKGWVCLHRRIMSNPLFRADPNARHLFMDLLAMAAWADTEQDWRGTPVKIERGQVMISNRMLCDVTGFSYQRVRSILIQLCRNGIAKLNSPKNKGPRIITICNFGKYQDIHQYENTPINSPDNDAPTHRTHDSNIQNNKRTNKQDNKLDNNTPTAITPRAMAERLDDQQFQDCKKAFNGNTEAMLQTVMAAMQPYGDRGSAARWLSTVMHANGAEAVAQAFVMLETKRASGEAVPLPLPYLSKTANTLKSKPKPTDGDKAEPAWVRERRAKYWAIMGENGNG